MNHTITTKYPLAYHVSATSPGEVMSHVYLFVTERRCTVQRMIEIFQERGTAYGRTFTRADP